jgi:DNA-directed RNA polymerase specialized sigma24 family protein
VKIDTQSKERSLDAKYPALDSPANLRILLSDIHALKVRQFQGDYDACVILVDLATAVEMAQLTGRQSEALRLVYEEDLTQEEAGKRMGIAQKNVSEALDRALENIAEVYYYWSRHGEGYAI